MSTISNQKIDETSDYSHAMIRELSNRIDSIWRYDQFIGNSSAHPEVRLFFERVKEQEELLIEELKELIAKHVKDTYL